jgi:hypothetical protein
MDKWTVIFLHIPKTGGRSLQNIILRNYSEDEVVVDAHKKGDELSAWDEERKLNIRYVQGHFIFGIHSKFPQPCKYVTLLRDPIDRVISHYYYVRRSPSHPLNRMIIEEGLDLEAYVTSGICDEVQNDQARLVAGVERGALVDEDRMLSMARENIDKHFLVAGITEQFDETLMLLKKRLELRNIYYGVRNQTIKRPLKKQISTTTLNLIAERNQADIELYDYVRAGLNRAIANEGKSFSNDIKRFKLLNRPYSDIFRFARNLKHKFTCLV